MAHQCWRHALLRVLFILHFGTSPRVDRPRTQVPATAKSSQAEAALKGLYNREGVSVTL